jgi:phytoene desaturase
VKKTVGIIGAGPGGMSAAVTLQSKGYHVEVFEAQSSVGGCNAALKLGDFRFDVGPTFFLMPSILEEIFERAGVRSEDYLKLHKIDPMYKLDFADGSELTVKQNRYEMAEEIAKYSKPDADNFFLFRERQKKKFDSILPILEQPVAGYKDLAQLKNIAAVPYVDGRSVYDELTDYFEDERTRLAFTFQAKYLGMSPFECPSMFTILPHIEHEFGVWHPEGGCNQVSESMAQLFLDQGGVLHLNTTVETVETASSKVSHLIVNGVEREFDHYVMNADFAYGMSELFSNESRKKYKDEKLETMKYSCSTFMLYLGLSEEVDLPHHSIYFSQNYRKNIRELVETLELSDDPSFYLHNPVVTDPTMAPEGKSAVYVLVPVPNLESKTEWTEEKVAEYRKLVLRKIRERTSVDLEPLIEEEKIVSPKDWRDEYRVYKGATFNLAHNFGQMLHWRPHNRSEEFENLYIVGGGTHPGSGLPTILESGKIAAGLIEKADDEFSVEKILRTSKTVVERGSWEIGARASKALNFASAALKRKTDAGSGF